MEKDWYLLIKGRVQKREWGDTNELEFKIKEISNLVDARDEKINSINIKIPIDSLTEDLVTEMYDIMEQGKGKKELQFMVFDPRKDIVIPMFSRNISVDISKELVEYLDRFPELEYSLK